MKQLACPKLERVVQIAPFHSWTSSIQTVIDVYFQSLFQCQCCPWQLSIRNHWICLFRSYSLWTCYVVKVIEHYLKINSTCKISSYTKEVLEIWGPPRKEKPAIFEIEEWLERVFQIHYNTRSISYMKCFKRRTISYWLCI